MTQETPSTQPCPRCTKDMDVPSPTPVCDGCSQELEQFAQVVAEGGVYWHCAGCKKFGVIKHTSPLAAQVRELAGVGDQPCGVEFHTCDEHDSPTTTH